jgi:hypothetical protein
VIHGGGVWMQVGAAGELYLHDSTLQANVNITALSGGKVYGPAAAETLTLTAPNTALIAFQQWSGTVAVTCASVGTLTLRFVLVHCPFYFYFL